MFQILLSVFGLWAYLATAQATDYSKRYPSTAQSNVTQAIPQSSSSNNRGQQVGTGSRGEPGKVGLSAMSKSPRPLPTPPISNQARMPQSQPKSVQIGQEGPQMDKQCSASCQKTFKMSPILVLSVDGASIRGVAQFELIRAIKERVSQALIKRGVASSKIPKSITDIFDFFAGTSAGSINVGSILVPDNPELANLPGVSIKPKFTLDELKEQMPATLAAAFSSTPFRKIRTMGGLLGSKYTAKDLQSLLQNVAGSARMSDLIKPAIITSYDIRNRKTMNFSTYEACRRKKEDEAVYMMPDQNGNMIKDINVYLWQAVRASSAAPTYYKPLELKSGGKDRALVDAGLYVMSPTLLAWSQVQKIYPGRRIVIISISSGTLVDNVRDIKSKGATAGSIPAVLEATIETALEGQQLLTDEMMQDLGVDYHRLTFSVKNKQFDDFSENNIQSLEQSARDTVETKDFEDVVNTLVKAHLARLNDPEPTVFTCATKVDDLKKEAHLREFFKGN